MTDILRIIGLGIFTMLTGAIGLIFIVLFLALTMAILSLPVVIIIWAVGALL